MKLLPVLRVVSVTSTRWVVNFEFYSSGLDSAGVEQFKAQVLEALPDSVRVRFVDEETDCAS